MKRSEQINDAIETYINDLFEDRVEITDEDHENITDAFLSGIEFADSHPKSTWISVESDLPCNHDEFIDKEKNMTKRVLVLGKDVKSNTISNIMSMFLLKIIGNGHAKFILKSHTGCQFQIYQNINEKDAKFLV